METWQRNLYTMLAVQFLMFVLFTSVFSYMPLFIIELGVQGQKEVAFWSGLISSISSLFAAFFSPLWGRLSDRSGYKLNLLRSCVAVVIFNFLSGTSVSVYQLLFFRVMQGCFSGFAAAAITMVGASTPASHLGPALGWLQTAQVLGAMLGPMVGGVLADTFSYRYVFFIASAVGAAATLLAYFLLTEPPSSKAAAARPSLSPLSPLFGLDSNRRQGIAAMLLVLFCGQFAGRCVEPVLSLYVMNLEPQATAIASQTGILFTAAAAGQLLAISLFLKRIPQWGYKKTLLLTLLGASLFYFPHALVTRAWHLLGLRLAVGTFLGAVLPASNAFIGLLAPPERKGSIYGLTTSATFMGSFLGVLGGGTISALLGIPAVFVTASILLFTAFLWVWAKIPDTAPSQLYISSKTAGETPCESIKPPQEDALER